MQGEQKIVTTPDDAGQYTFNNLAAGVWKLQVETFGFSPASREVTIDDKPSTIEWTLELKPLSAPISNAAPSSPGSPVSTAVAANTPPPSTAKPSSPARSEEHTSELQSHLNLVCRLLLEKKKKSNK